MAEAKRITVTDVMAAKKEGRKLVVLTAYDYSMAQIVDGAGVDIILVGDSLGNVVLGHESTLPVTMEDMLRHTAAVARGAARALVVGDMPFLSYQVSPDEARRNAGLFLKEGGAAAVKIEGGREFAPLAASLVDMGVPVMGHVGLTPQSVHRFGGYRVQGKDELSAQRIREGARAMEEAGAFAVVLEGIPAALAATITADLSVPTIGIGAGPSCDGQVLVLNDMLGLYRGFRPKFVKVYADIGTQVEKAVKEYADEVRRGVFPDKEHSF